MKADIAEMYANDENTNELKERVFETHYIEKKVTRQQKKRVAAYCRVSTDTDEQLESLDNQMAAFKYQISMHDDWELVDIYVDSGISATEATNRADFCRMISDCEAGKIDRIITKSISRFARNTMDCLNYVRKLKTYGTDIFFEKENIDTAESASEILLTVMAAFAQEESRSISENVKWGLRKRFEAGKEIIVPIYGYRHTDEEKYIIVPEEAKIVNEIFERYVHGETPQNIIDDMSRRNVPPPGGDRWKLMQITRMLNNEKYIGDVVLQKHYVENYLTHKEVLNRGEVPMYRIRNAHPAIIDRHLFKQANAVAHMKNVKIGNNSYPYGTMLKCPWCGKTLLHGSTYALYFGRKKFHNGAWGCYSANGCRRYLVLQDILDKAILEAYEKKYGIRRERVDYYWLDDLIQTIHLGTDDVTVVWKDNTRKTVRLGITHKDYIPEKTAQKYNAFLDWIRQGKIQNNKKNLMGLQERGETDENTENTVIS